MPLRSGLKIDFSFSIQTKKNSSKRNDRYYNVRIYSNEKNNKMKNSEHLYKAISERILVLDGAMGTMLQRYKFEEEDYRGERFKNWEHPLKGNNDLLSLTQPQAIEEVHRKYLEAGADIIETNTFSGTTIAMADYHMEDLVYELNYESAKIARKVCDEFTAKNPEKPRFVAGSIGPTNNNLTLLCNDLE